MNGVSASGYADEQLSLSIGNVLETRRIGCNMAEDGMLFILSFKTDSECQYEAFMTADNWLHGSNEVVQVDVENTRATISPQFRHSRQ